eukprot:gb/GEZN01010315.1/.p1 GENE.gb/GEZN01010315.1/~~gb/GEZN01010315.1/.p1  ORF type:complete len:244 (+),score=34.66 gb/GEZN01010315.1/:130-861(+)
MGSSLAREEESFEPATHLSNYNTNDVSQKTYVDRETPAPIRPSSPPTSPGPEAVIKAVALADIPANFTALQWYRTGCTYFYQQVSDMTNGSGKAALEKYCNPTACAVMMVGKYKVVSPLDRKIKTGPEYMRDTLVVVNQDLTQLTAQQDITTVKKNASKALQRLFRGYVHCLLKHAHEPALVTNKMREDFGVLVLFVLSYGLMDGSNKELQLVGSYVNQAIEKYPKPSDVEKLCVAAFRGVNV